MRYFSNPKKNALSILIGVLLPLLLNKEARTQTFTADYGITVSSLSTTSTGAVNGTTFAVPGGGAAVISWQVVADGSALSTSLQASLDNSTFFTIDTQTTATGGLRTVGPLAVSFIRITQTSRTGGTATTGTLQTQRGYNTNNSSGYMGFADGTSTVPSIYSATLPTTGFYFPSSGTSIASTVHFQAPRFTLTAGTMTDAVAPFTQTATMPASSTGANVAYSLTTTGAGNSSQAQYGINSTFSAGYTGSSISAAVRAVNSTVGSGLTYGGIFTADGATTGTGIGISGNATGATKNIGGFFSPSVDPSTLSYPGGVTSLPLAASNGSNASDIITAFDGTTRVFSIQNNGDAIFTGLNANSSTTFTFNTASKGAIDIVANGNTSGIFGTSNNIPLFFKTNGSNRWGIDTSGNLGVGTTPNLVYLITAPTYTSGISTGTPTVAGKASAFSVTVGATPSASGVIAFNGTFTNVPSCSCTNTVTANLVQCTPTTTQVTLAGTWLANDIIRCLCIGY